MRGMATWLLALGMTLILAAPASAAAPSVLAWGEGEVGQLGDGHTARTDVPVAVSGLGEATALAGGREYGLALRADGAVMAWGENSWGQLGVGDDTGPETCHAAFAAANEYAVPCSTTPVPVAGLGGVTAIATGAQHSLALLANGTVMAWGANESGQLGDGSMSGPDHCYKETEPVQCATAPQPVPGLSEVEAIAAGQNFSLALLKNGTVMAWGSNQSGELGIGYGSWGDATPTPVSGLSDVAAIAAGEHSALALLGDGTVVAWGANELGQLGDGTLVGSAVPVPVAGLTDVSAIAAGEGGLALRADGTLMAWGSNVSGELGAGTLTGPSECFPLNFCATTPVPVSGIEHVTAIAAGGSHDLALLSDGEVLDWGLGWEGELGDGTTEISDSPVAVSDLGNATAIAAGNEFALAYGEPREAPHVGGQVVGEGEPAATTDGQTDPPASGSKAAGSGAAPLLTRLDLPLPSLTETDLPIGQRLAHQLRTALRACRKKPKRERVACEQRAHRSYARALRDRARAGKRD
jgi:alpha-tubulin suppressor-like RCC1 family protein